MSIESRLRKIENELKQKQTSWERFKKNIALQTISKFLRDKIIPESELKAMYDFMVKKGLSNFQLVRHYLKQWEVKA